MRLPLLLPLLALLLLLLALLLLMPRWCIVLLLLLVAMLVLLPLTAMGLLLLLLLLRRWCVLRTLPPLSLRPPLPLVSCILQRLASPLAALPLCRRCPCRSWPCCGRPGASLGDAEWQAAAPCLGLADLCCCRCRLLRGRLLRRLPLGDAEEFGSHRLRAGRDGRPAHLLTALRLLALLRRLISCAALPPLPLFSVLLLVGPLPSMLPALLRLRLAALRLRPLCSCLPGCQLPLALLLHLPRWPLCLLLLLLTLPPLLSIPANWRRRRLRVHLS